MEFSNSLGAPGLGDFENYTFNEKELADVLGYIERQQSGGLVDPIPSFLSPTGLQFQPHPIPPPASAARTCSLDFVIKPDPEPFDLMDLGGMQPLAPTIGAPTPQQQPLPPSVGPSGSSSSNGGSAGVQVPVAELASVSISQPTPDALFLQQQQQQQQQAAAAAAAAAAAYAPPPPVAELPRQHIPAAHHGRKGEGKPHVSHSTVEKQRRDRINSLIDELRELVPPHGPNASGSGTLHAHDPHDGKQRPKHVVLSDTIAMVKELQERLTMSEAALSRLREHEEHCPFHDHEQHQAALRAGMAAEHSGRGGEASSGSHGSHPELPHAPEGTHAPTEPEVCVEEGEEGCLFVKVSCKDRHGLLSDIVRALKAIPVEILTAAITTTKDGGVYDVFQVTPEEGGQAIDREEVVACIQTVIEEHHTGDKRRRDNA